MYYTIVHLFFGREGDFMCEHDKRVFMEGVVTRSSYTGAQKFHSQSDVFYLWIGVKEEQFIKPQPGQFFMLRPKNSTHTLARPISVFAVKSKYDKSDPLERGPEYGFLIMEKGEGTKELIRSPKGTKIEILGPLGNGFPTPSEGSHVCLIGGGIGIAPIMYCARELAHNGFKSFDTYVGYKDYAYGIDYVGDSSIDNIAISSESGRVGTKGMLDSIIDAEVLVEKGYTVVYACGPIPMLKYVQEICRVANVECWLSLENNMACGVGACLGCTIHTIDGNKRCCKDGPVFNGAEVDFSYSEKKKIFTGKSKSETSCLGVEIAGVKFKNPIIAASGTFGYGVEYSDIVDIELLGGCCSKGLTLTPRQGNKGTRIYETSGGMMNSIGLENPGIQHFIDHEMPQMLGKGLVVIANLSGSSIEEYIEGAKLLDHTNIDMIELNISCPNVKSGGMSFGMAPMSAYDVVSGVRSATSKPLIVKLTPNAPHLLAVCDAVRTAGADAISLVNTFQAMAIDIETGCPIFKNTYAGLSGPGIKPIALRMVHQVAKNMKSLPKKNQIPIIGVGGITTWQDVVEFIMAGATAVEMGTATFANPNAMVDVIKGLSQFMQEKHFASIEDFRGVVLRE